MALSQAGRRTCITQNSYFATMPDKAEDGDLIAIGESVRRRGRDDNRRRVRRPRDRERGTSVNLIASPFSLRSAKRHR